MEKRIKLSDANYAMIMSLVSDELNSTDKVLESIIFSDRNMTPELAALKARYEAVPAKNSKTPLKKLPPRRPRKS
jgi:hypothetical protein